MVRIHLREQRDGPFWQRASLDPDYDGIQIPVFLIGGFLDGYGDTLPRFFEHAVMKGNISQGVRGE